MLIFSLDRLACRDCEASLRSAIASSAPDAQIEIDWLRREVHIAQQDDQAAQLILGLENAGFLIKSLCVD